MHGTVSTKQTAHVAAGDGLSVVVEDDGTAYTCGVHGALCHRRLKQRSAPKMVASMNNKRVVFAAAGSTHVVLLTEDGEVWTAGLHGEGQLGHGSTKSLSSLLGERASSSSSDDEDPAERQLKPKLVAPMLGHSVVHAAAGAAHTVLVTDQGQVFSCGSNSGEEASRSGGPLGLSGIEATNTPTIVPLPADIRIVQAAAGESHTLLLSDTGSVYSMGTNLHGQLGVGGERRANEQATGAPEVIQGLAEAFIVRIAAGGDHSVAVSDQGRVWSWGAGDHGQTGHGDTTDRRKPCVVRGLEASKMVTVAAGKSHMVTQSQDGIVYAWGRGNMGQLGAGDFQDRLAPEKVKWGTASTLGTLNRMMASLAA